MTRSGAPFHGAHGEGRSALSPAGWQSGAELCARAFPAARARRNAPVISDNAVVAAPMNWRAESTGNPLPLSRPATQLAEIMAKVDRPFAVATSSNGRVSRAKYSVSPICEHGAVVRPRNPARRTHH